MLEILNKAPIIWILCPIEEMGILHGLSGQGITISFFFYRQQREQYELVRPQIESERILPDLGLIGLADTME